MTEDERLQHLLRSTLAPASAAGPSCDLWPAIVRRSQAPARWSWLDVSLATAVVLVLLMFPHWFWIVAYHL